LSEVLIKKILFYCDIQYFCAVKEMITIPRSEYEQMKREIAELQTMVRQLEEAIALLKGGRNCRTSSTAHSRSNSISLRISSGRKSGGQVSHCDHNLQMVDRFIVLCLSNHQSSIKNCKIYA